MQGLVVYAISGILRMPLEFITPCRDLRFIGFEKNQVRRDHRLQLCRHRTRSQGRPCLGATQVLRGCCGQTPSPRRRGIPAGQRFSCQIEKFKIVAKETHSR